jgi:hypothetical protein
VALGIDRKPEEAALIDDIAPHAADVP